jgi:7-cyano-7-deazaguanine reductase
MALQELDNSIINKHLGQTSQYKSQYDASLLVREERQSNRKHLDLDENNLPFGGYDTWNAYEVSGLTDNGMPVTGIAKIAYPCDSKYIVESKSLKLYFNSFNSTKLGETPNDVRSNIVQHVSNDLSKYLETDVFVNVFSNKQVLDNNLMANAEWQDVSRNVKDNSLSSHDTYISLEDTYPVDQVQFDTYTETPDLLEIINDAPVSSVHYHSALLKSNCRVTSQPDWGDVYIDMFNSKCTVDPISLLKYIVSFRDECHFHEEICETIYKRLHDLLQPEMLAVRCLYARRGGIDINPERVSHAKLSHNNLSRVVTPHIKTPKQ